MSMRNSVFYIENPSGGFHMYQEAGGGDICIEVFKNPDSPTYYGDMYLTLKELKEIKKGVDEMIEWLETRNERTKAILSINAHMYDEGDDSDSEN